MPDDGPAQTSAQPENQDNEQPINSPVVAAATEQTSRKKLWFGLLAGLLFIFIVGDIAWWLTIRHHKTTPAAVVSPSKTASPTSTTSSNASTVQGLHLDTNKNYGNKYANGLLPVGDSKYQTTGPKVGYVYVCSQYAQSLSSGQGGAGSRGPWFVNNNTEYDITKKLHVQGNVMWTADFSNKVSGSTRTIITNDLPTHPTGVFPIAATDPAYAYDRNPNSIKGQTLTYNLSANPTYNLTPNCMGGESGIMLTGVALFNGFDAGGRDAGAWEVQDSCEGHPQNEGEYHYHTLSSCIKDISVKTVIGFALDGFPITGPDVGTNNILTTSDLDECHGLTSEINLDGKSVMMYHYVMTEDFPYSVSCFRGQAIQPPGLQSQGQTPQVPPHP